LLQQGRVSTHDFFISSSIDIGQAGTDIKIWPDAYGFDPQGLAHRIGGIGLCWTAQATLLTVIGINSLRSDELAGASILDEHGADEVADIPLHTAS